MTSLEKSVELIIQKNKEQSSLTPAKSGQQISDRSYAESRDNLVQKEESEDEEEE